MSGRLSLFGSFRPYFSHIRKALKEHNFLTNILLEIPHTQKDCNILERINRISTRVVYKQGYKQQDISPTEQLQDIGWKPLQQLLFDTLKVYYTTN